MIRPNKAIGKAGLARTTGGIQRKVAFLPALAVAGLAVMIFLQFDLRRKEERLLSALEVGYFPLLDSGKTLQRLMSEIQRGFQDAVGARDLEKLEEADLLRQRFLDVTGTARQNPVIVREEVDQLTAEFVRYYAYARVTSERMIGDETGAELLTDVTRMVTGYSAIKSRLDRFTTNDEARMRAAFLSARKFHVKAVISTAGLLLICFGVVAWFSVLIIRSLNSNLSLFESTLESTADGILVVNGEGAIRVYNRRFSEMMSVSPLGLHGQKYADGLADTGKHLQNFEEAREKTAAIDRRSDEESSDILLYRDGRVLERHSFPQRMNGRAIGRVWCFRDVTEKTALERMKSEFVSTVSHELRTPLTSIRGALGLLSSGMLGTLGEKGQRMLQIAVSNTDRLVRLINDILDLERIGSGKIELSRSDVDAGALMTQAVEGVQSMADDSGVFLAVDPVPITLSVDSDRIVQTLTNLLSNAIKFSPRGTTVAVSGRAAGGTFTFRVTDQGRGVPADKLETIFERFKQVDASDSRDKGGSGLGLAICRSIVNAHHGRIWAERNGGGGSVFQFSIPIERGAPAVEPAYLLKPRTLVVCREDESAMPLIVETLENHGFYVVCLPTADVTSQAAAIAPDAILLDLAGNSGNGWQIVDALKANEQTHGIPIIVATALSQESFESHAAGIASWVRKPFETEDLIHAVDVACASPAVLIVEDDVDLARVMTASLQSRGIRTLHATTGQEALHLCTQHQPILIVLDLGLPDIDGFAVVTSLRRQKTLSGTPLLIYSATEVGSVDQARLELGPTEFLTKSRGSLQDFTSQVVRMLNTVIVPTEETQHAA